MSISLYGRWYDLRSKISEILRFYWRYKPNRWYLFAAIVLQIFLWFFAYRLFVAVGKDLFVAHYNVDFGIDAIGSAVRAFNIPFLALGVIILNLVFFLSCKHSSHVHFLAHASGLASILAQFLGALALFSLYLINFLS